MCFNPPYINSLSRSHHSKQIKHSLSISISLSLSLLPIHLVWIHNSQCRRDQAVTREDLLRPFFLSLSRISQTSLSQQILHPLSLLSHHAIRSLRHLRQLLRQTVTAMTTMLARKGTPLLIDIKLSFVLI